MSLLPLPCDLVLRMVCAPGNEALQSGWWYHSHARSCMYICDIQHIQQVRESCHRGYVSTENKVGQGLCSICSRGPVQLVYMLLKLDAGCTHPY